MSGGVTVLFKKSNPLVERFNILMTRYFAGKALDRTAASSFFEGWSEIDRSSW